MTHEVLPAYSDLILPTIRVVTTLGGSATAREITSQVLADLAPTEEMLAVAHEHRPDSSVLLERIHWARSYAKLIGALESPKRGVFLVTPLGKELASMSPDEGARRTLELDREYRRNRTKRARQRTAVPIPADPEEAEAQAAEAEEEESLFRVDSFGTEPERWQDALLARLHRLSPDGFEEFVLYLLRLYGLQLERVGGSVMKESTGSELPRSARCSRRASQYRSSGMTRTASPWAARLWRFFSGTHRPRPRSEQSS